MAAHSESILGLQKDSKAFGTGPLTVTEAPILQHLLGLLILESPVLGCYGHRHLGKDVSIVSPQKKWKQAGLEIKIGL